jgi:hypothetical protein
VVRAVAAIVLTAGTDPKHRPTVQLANKEEGHLKAPLLILSDRRRKHHTPRCSFVKEDLYEWTGPSSTRADASDPAQNLNKIFSAPWRAACIIAASASSKE